MKFGKVDNVDEIDFSIPPDHPDTDRVLKKSKAKDLDVYVGCGKWNKKDLKDFYPRGTKNELEYYATQFNAIELNATFRKRYWAPQYEKWANTTPERWSVPLSASMGRWQKQHCGRCRTSRRSSALHKLSAMRFDLVTE